MLPAAGVLLWYLRKDRPHGDAVLAGVFISPLAYTLRFLLVGRGHDALEWQAAQSVLGGNASGHAVDILFNRLFDPLFSEARILDIPPGIESR